MTINGWIQIALYVAIIVALTRPVGFYLHRVAGGGNAPLDPILRPVERGMYAACGVDPAREQSWVGYALSVMLFKVACFLGLYGLLRFQAVLPLNPAGQVAVPPDLSLNTAISFLTNTNWQSYGGESTMSHLSQMAGLGVQNFVSAAAGISIAFAFIRGFTRRSAGTIGNFWVDLTRVTLHVLLPISFVFALVLVWQGVPQTLLGTIDATTLEGVSQTIAVGPVASQEAIKMLGTNGGGFFNANSAHPFENPTALANLLAMVSIFVLGAGLTNTLGRMAGAERQGWAILAAMGVLFIAGVAVAYGVEAQGNPAFAAFGVDPTLGNMEGKEVRFGVTLSALFAVITTAASCGAVNAMHSSFLPLAGMVPLVNMMLGEIIVGGVGAGLYGFLLFAIIAMFIAGLMVGRTPEYLGKKIEAREVKLTMLAVLCLPLAMLGFTALAVVLDSGTASLSTSGPAWLQRGAVRLHLGRRQQWQRLCRAVGEHTVLGPNPRGGDAAWAILRDHPGARHCWFAGRQETRAAIRRHVPD